MWIMNKRISFSILALLFATISFAADTVVVSAQQNRDLVWYERYTDWAVFPSNQEFHQVNMQFTMGCASGGCSDWDYTVKVFLLHPTGTYDSSIASIDTISTNPLVVDTSWNVFEVKERFELGRLITPYGNYMATSRHGYNNNWKHRYDFDVTDMQILMKDSVEIEVFYQGWSAGFSASIDFHMIEGTPPRRVRRIENIYAPGGYNYFTPQQFESDVLPATTIHFDAEDKGAALRFIPSGHGFVNALNCAEFCKRNYEVKINGVKQFEQLMWRDDCGLNPIYPQGGTWLYDRANWCPGSEVVTYLHELTGLYNPGDSINFDINIEPIIYTVPSGETPANYNLSAQLITYEEPLRNRDAAINRILSPNEHEQYGRFNPSCGKAQVEIINKGSEPLTQVEIHYGIHSARRLKYTWTGNLGFMQTEIVDLPFGNPENWYSYYGVNEFSVWTVTPNAQSDEYPANDPKIVNFEAPQLLPSEFRLNFGTNNRGDHTYWFLRDANGSVIDSGDNYTANSIHNINFTLDPGCYELYFGDRGKNGLAFWANNEGSGFLRLMSASGVLKNFNPDFGTEIRHYFTVGFGLEDEKFVSEKRFGLYPNPTCDVVNLQSEGHALNVVITDQMGRVVRQLSLQPGKQSIDLSGLARGAYYVQLMDEKGREVHKIIKD
jgi:hypothetical protein